MGLKNLDRRLVLNPSRKSVRGRHSARTLSEMSFETLEVRRLLGGDQPVLIDHGGVPANGTEAQANERWTRTATNSSTGSTGNPITLTWGFVADGLSIPGGSDEPTSPSFLQAFLNAQYGSSAVWQPLFQSVFDRWSALAGLTYVFTGYSDDGAAFVTSSGVLGIRPDVRIGGHPVDGQFNTLAYNYFPPSGDMVFDIAEFGSGGVYTNTSNNSRRLRHTIGHEHGHGMGLDHVDPNNGTKMMEPSYVGTFDGPQFDDIYGAQKLYGDPYEKGGRNDTAATADDLGTFATNATSIPVSQWLLANNPINPRSIANTNDYDYLKFTLTSSKTVSLAANPFGPSYLQGPDGGTATLFDARMQGDLSLAIFGPDGTTLLDNAASNPLGIPEVASASLPPGTYYLRVGISSGTTQPYDLSMTITNPSAIAPASTPDLSAASDSGISSTDNITTNNLPTFIGTANVGAYVDLYLNGIGPVGSDVADASGNWSITPNTSLGDGSYLVTARMRTGNTAVSSALTFTIDRVAPAAPTGFRIRSDLDTGISNSDGVTLVNQPILVGSSESNSLLLVSEAANGFAPFAATGGFNFEALMPNSLGNGTYTVVGHAQDLAGNISAGSTSFTLTVDTVSPTLSVASFQRSPSQAIDFSFSENIFGTLNLILTRGAQLVNVAAGTTTSNSRRFVPTPANSLVDGIYTNQIFPTGLTDLAGNPPGSLPITTFKFLRADFNGDDAVNFDDLLILSQNYGTTGLTHAQGDANYSGQINFDDLLVVAQTYGNVLLSNGASSTLSGTTSAVTRRRGSNNNNLIADVLS